MTRIPVLPEETLPQDPLTPDGPLEAFARLAERAAGRRPLDGEPGLPRHHAGPARTAAVAWLREGRPVLLISMPFGLPTMPSLGISVLKAALVDRGIPVEVKYFSLRFVDRIGYSLYQKIAQGEARLLGEWIFRAALFGLPTQEERETFWRDEFPDRSTAGLHQTFEGLQECIRSLQELAVAFIDECAAELRAATYPIIGFTTLFQQDLASLALAAALHRQSPGSIIVFGGPNCEEWMGYSLLRAFDFIDCVFSGEADHTFPEFVEKVRSGEVIEPVGGVIARRNRGGEVVRPERWVDPVKVLDTTPIPDFDDYFTAVRKLAHPLKPHLCFETARGCWWGESHHCTFCGLNGLTMAFRSKSSKARTCGGDLSARCAMATITT